MFLPIPPVFDAHVGGGGPRRNIAMTFGTEKLERRAYPMMFICFDKIHERDRQTDRQTDRHADMRLDSNLRLRRFINHLLTYLHHMTA